MVQILLIIAIVLFFVWYARRKPKTELTQRGEVERRADIYRDQVMSFVRKVKKSPTQTSRQRLDIELQRLEKIAQLDTALEKAEREESVGKAIDLYLEALSLVMQLHVELERKSEIEERIKELQHQQGKEVLR